MSQTKPISSRLEAVSLDCVCEPQATDATPIRCGCGSLLARQVPGGIELKCRRCKQVVVVRLSTN